MTQINIKLQSYQTLEHDMDSACYAPYARDTGFSFIVRIVVLSFIEISALMNFHFIEPHRGEYCTLVAREKVWAWTSWH